MASASATPTKRLHALLSRPVDAANVGAFRALFGLLVLIATVRSWQKGVIEQAFLEPQFFFSYFGAPFVVPPGSYAYALYGVLGIASALLALGLYPRAMALLVCGLFSYLHFVDLTHYLNHYYLVSLLSALLAVLPSSSFAALSKGGRAQLPAWTLYLLRFQIGVVYFFGGVAKLKSDWLFRAEPMRTWLAANTDLPLLGPLLTFGWVPFAFSWLGAIYDLSVPFALSARRTRPYAYFFVVVFHLLTARLFQIGMFPYLMLSGSLLFLSPSWPRVLLRRATSAQADAATYAISSTTLVLIALYVGLQLALPMRRFLYPGNTLWTEQGYRWSWNVMLIEKTGSAEFTLEDRASGQRRVVFARSLLTRAQTKAMATQPDMILAFAHELARRERAQGREVAVYADVWVALNGRAPQQLIDPAVDLTQERESFFAKRWILPLTGE